MEMKNKLYKHHKTKTHFILRDTGIIIGSIGALFAVVTLPTYISIKTQIDSPSLADEEKEDTESSEALLSVENLKDKLN